jgi:hypothetical protein
VLDGPDSAAIGAALAAFDAVVSSHSLGVELHRVGLRTGIARQEIETWLARVALVQMDAAILSAAAAVSHASVATLDAIHLATALRLAVVAAFPVHSASAVGWSLDTVQCDVKASYKYTSTGRQGWVRNCPPAMKQFRDGLRAVVCFSGSVTSSGVAVAASSRRRFGLS